MFYSLIMIIAAVIFIICEHNCIIITKEICIMCCDFLKYEILISPNWFNFNICNILLVNIWAFYINYGHVSIGYSSLYIYFKLRVPILIFYLFWIFFKIFLLIINADWLCSYYICIYFFYHNINEILYACTWTVFRFVKRPSYIRQK